MSYFVISADEDGGGDIERVDEATLLTRLNDCWYGEDPRFLSTLVKSEHSDCEKLEHGCWHGKVVIKGEIVVPKKKQVVTKYEIE